MEFWREHKALRLALMTLFFVAGMAMLVQGWKMTGNLTGLGIMLAGLILVLLTLALYNKPFEDAKKK